MDAAIRKAKDSLGQIFDKNLHDLVRGIRNHKENEVNQILVFLEYSIYLLNFKLKNRPNI
jgi:hypothetical protein